jgi:hypothetical protein
MPHDRVCDGTRVCDACPGGQGGPDPEIEPDRSLVTAADRHLEDRLRAMIAD